MKERENLTYSYILLEGICRLLLLKHPHSSPGGTLSNRTFDSATDSHSNILSLIIEKTPPLNFSLGTLCPTIWIGEELCSDTHTSLPYSVLAETKIKVLRIDCDTMRELFPKDFHDRVHQLQDKKRLWFETKCLDIEKNAATPSPPRKFYYPAKTTFANKFLNISDKYTHKIDGQFPPGRPIIAMHQQPKTIRQRELRRASAETPVQSNNPPMIMVFGDPMEVHKKKEKRAAGKANERPQSTSPKFNIKLQSLESRGSGVVAEAAETPILMTED